jgi:hypothetical protein
MPAWADHARQHWLFKGLLRSRQFASGTPCAAIEAAEDRANLVFGGFADVMARLAFFE